MRYKMKLFTKYIFILLLFSLTSSCSITNQAISMKHPFYTENNNYNEAQLKFIEEALIKSETIESLGELTKNGHRLHIDSHDDNNVYIHIGSQDPYQGGSGYNYSIDTKSSEVTLLSSETYAPVPSFE